MVQNKSQGCALLGGVGPARERKEQVVEEPGREHLRVEANVPEPNAIIIRTEKLNIFHTGDWKIDPTPLVGNPIDQTKFSNLKKEGIDVMVCDALWLVLQSNKTLA